MAFNLTQTEEPKRIVLLRVAAILAFPNDNPQDAFSKYINEKREHNVFFLDENGRRCVWRETGEFMSLYYWYLAKYGQGYSLD
jgi:hypothetical protein